MSGLGSIRETTWRTGHAAAGLRDALERAEADPFNCVVRTWPEAVAAQVQDLETRLVAGERPVLAGVPILIKDNICFRGQETTAASAILAGFRPPYTATVVDRLIAAGAIIIGHANMDEFAMGSSTETSVHGPTRNPAAPDRIPGGSSGGSAAAVAGGIVPVALGSDTGGSIRQPASLCGCVGLKPTYGRVSRHGLIAFGSSLDQIGPLTTSVADAALVLSVIAGHDVLDSTSAPTADADGDVLATLIDETDPVRGLAGLRIGHCPHHREGLQPAVAARLEATLHTLASAGAALVEIDLPHEHFAVAMYYVLATGEASSNLSRFDGVHYGWAAGHADDLVSVYTNARSAGFGTEVKRRIMLGTYVLSAGYFDAYYKKAQKVRELLVRDYAAAFATCDVILGPTCPTTAFRLGERLADPLQMYLFDIFTIGTNLAGLPGISVPCGRDGEGLPIGLHLQAPQWEEARLLRAATALESLHQD